MALTRYKTVTVDDQQVTVKVDSDALVPINSLQLRYQYYTGKVKIGRNDGASHTLGSLPEQLYGSSYRYARHTSDDVHDLRRTAFSQSEARLKRMKIA